jgi:hypothetical protein
VWHVTSSCEAFHEINKSPSDLLEVSVHHFFDFFVVEVEGEGKGEGEG